MNIICALFCRYSFPFGRPEGALKATLSLFERVSIVMFAFCTVDICRNSLTLFLKIRTKLLVLLYVRGPSYRLGHPLRTVNLLKTFNFKLF